MTRLLFVASEAYPLIKTGGLADIAGSLPEVLRQQGVDVRLLLPAYRHILDSIDPPRTVAELELAGTPLRLLGTVLPGTGVETWLLDHPSFVARPGNPYHGPDGEPWESVQITIQDGMEVPPGFDLGFGEWNVIALDGTVLIFDDYFYNFADVMEGQCYNNATGIYTYTFGAFKLEPYADGIPIVNCAVGVEDISLGSVKAMFR